MNTFRTGIVLFAISVLAIFYNCREDFDFEPATQSLSFSIDTVSIDTVFTNYNSDTFSFTVRNQQDDDVVVSNISLRRGSNSFFRINIDGEAGFDFNDVRIRANDSIFVFVEIAVPDTSSMQYEDEIIFETNEIQEVKLLSWIERTTYYLADSSGEVQITESSWDNSTSRFISGRARIMNDFTITEGTKVYFFNDSSLEFESGTDVSIQGTRENRVIFRSHRQRPRYDSLPDQWDRVLLNENVTASINYAKFIGGRVGLETSSNNNVTLENSEFYNNQDYGIKTNNSTINARNIVANNSNMATLGIFGGGDYEFYHSTFANYFRFNAGSRVPLVLNNANEEGIVNNLDANFQNCIFYGSTFNGVDLQQNNGAAFNYNFNTCVVRNNNTNTLNIETDSNFSNSILEDPLFRDFGFGNTNLRLQEESPALNLARILIANLVPLGYDGNSRTSTNPDIGAYENVF